MFIQLFPLTFNWPVKTFINAKDFDRLPSDYLHKKVQSAAVLSSALGSLPEHVVARWLNTRQSGAIETQ
jgi:hypothetical protein